MVKGNISEKFLKGHNYISASHRSYAWKPMYDSKPEKETVHTIENTIIPMIEKLSGVSWKRDSYMIISEEITIVLSEDKEKERLYQCNEIVRKLIDNFPTLTEEDFGYRLIVAMHNKGNNVHYRGQLAFNHTWYTRRGEIVAKNYSI
jgi:hypothetical protein